jgi:hypothetical protein
LAELKVKEAAFCDLGNKLKIFVLGKKEGKVTKLLRMTFAYCSTWIGFLFILCPPGQPRRADVTPSCPYHNIECKYSLIKNI